VRSEQSSLPFPLACCLVTILPSCLSVAGDGDGAAAAASAGGGGTSSSSSRCSSWWNSAMMLLVRGFFTACAVREKQSDVSLRCFHCRDRKHHSLISGLFGLRFSKTHQTFWVLSLFHQNETPRVIPYFAKTNSARTCPYSTNFSILLLKAALYLYPGSPKTSEAVTFHVAKQRKPGIFSWFARRS